MKHILLMIALVALVGCGKKEANLCPHCGIETAPHRLDIHIVRCDQRPGSQLWEFNQIKARAEQGSVDAQYELGCMYHDGQDGTLLGLRDYKEAAHWFRKAADQGLPEAQVMLGLYYEGGGVTQDFKEAFRWYRRAADQGSVQAQYKLGVKYDKGEGIPEDDKEAVKWFLKAADQGSAHAQYQLGVKYDKGEGVELDSVTAYAWWNIAAANGNVSAQKDKQKAAMRLTSRPPYRLEEAQDLSREMIKKNPKLLN